MTLHPVFQINGNFTILVQMTFICTCANCNWELALGQGRIPDFEIEGAQKMMCMHAAHIPSAKGEVPYGRGPGPGRLRNLDALSCYLSLFFFLHSDTKPDFKEHIRSKFRGGARLLRHRLGPPL